MRTVSPLIKLLYLLFVITGALEFKTPVAVSKAEISLSLLVI